MKQRITILVNSCDKYEDAWHPFFECLWHFAGELPYPIILNTETKQYYSQRYDVQTVNTPKSATWSERLLHVLDSVQTEFVLFLLEDYFLQAPFDTSRLEKVIQYMSENASVGFVDIKPRWANTKKEYELNLEKYAEAPDEFVERNNPQYNITCAPAIWRTSSLRKLLRCHEDVWAFEKYVGNRAKNNQVKVVRYQTHSPCIYEYEDQIWGTKGITFGKWLPGNIPFFEEMGIDVDFENLGILNAESLAEVSKMKKGSAKYLKSHIVRKIKEIINIRKSLY